MIPVHPARCARIIAGSAAGVIEERRGRIFAAEGPVIADISPYPAGDRLQFRQHRHGCIVDMEPIGGEDMMADYLENGIKGCNTSADPARVETSILMPSRA